MSSNPDDPRSPHIRRQPTGPIPHVEDTSTRIIRRAPISPETPTTLITAPTDSKPSGRTAVAAAATAILSGWPTAVLATDLISGWWNTDRLFCLAVGFLTVLIAGATVCGVILLMLRRGAGRWLIAFGAALALLTFASVFVAGARVAWPVYLIPVLPLASLGLSVQPATARWCGSS